MINWLHRDRQGGTNEHQRYDRKADDLGNVVALEHVNVTIPDQATAVTFYVLGLGLTRDPYMNVG